MNKQTSLFLLILSLFLGLSPQSAEALKIDTEARFKCLPGHLKNGTMLSKNFAKSYAKSQLHRMGWNKSEWKYLLTLWNRESRWDYTAKNPDSTAYGIAQILGTRKNTTAIQQVDAGFRYIKSRYGTPSRALRHHYRMGWY